MSIDTDPPGRARPTPWVRRFVVAAAASMVLAGAVDLLAAGSREPTFHRDVAPILRQHCQGCHRPGDIGPFPLLTYEDARPWAAALLNEVDAGRMPPWSPDEGLGQFVDERRIPERDRDVLAAWVEAGAPEGPVRKSKALPPADGSWPLGEPDLVLSPSEIIEVTGSDDIYRCYPLPTSYSEDRWIRAVDVRPGDRRVVHHVILFLETSGEALLLDEAEEGPGYTCFGGTGTSVIGAAGGWAPGFRAMELDREVGIRLPAGATVVMQVHYHPDDDLPAAADREHGNGDGHDEPTEVGLWFHDEAPAEELFILPVGVSTFTIPADDPEYEITTTYPVPFVDGMRVHTVAPHMHLLGRTMRLDAELPDGTEQTLVSVSDWNFDWQANYVLRRPVAVPFQSTLHLRATFDNSSANPNNPSLPPVPVSYGDATTDEMCWCFLGITIGRGNAVRRAPEVKAVKVSRKGILKVRTRGLQKGARIEIDGVPVEDGAGRRTLRSRAAWQDLVPEDGEATLCVRNPDGRRSATVTITR